MSDHTEQLSINCWTSGAVRTAVDLLLVAEIVSGLVKKLFVLIGFYDTTDSDEYLKVVERSTLVIGPILLRNFS
ncbi:hypothetical protein FG05_35008 [Fusarium graminearum]|nr:hypothetical protein FG05_35008 [Fusarium graminearum]